MSNNLVSLLVFFQKSQVVLASYMVPEEYNLNFIKHSAVFIFRGSVMNDTPREVSSCGQNVTLIWCEPNLLPNIKKYTEI